MTKLNPLIDMTKFTAGVGTDMLATEGWQIKNPVSHSTGGKKKAPTSALLQPGLCFWYQFHVHSHPTLSYQFHTDKTSLPQPLRARKILLSLTPPRQPVCMPLVKHLVAKHIIHIPPSYSTASLPCHQIDL